MNEMRGGVPAYGICHVLTRASKTSRHDVPTVERHRFSGLIRELSWGLWYMPYAGSRSIVGNSVDEVPASRCIAIPSRLIRELS